MFEAALTEQFTNPFEALLTAEGTTFNGGGTAQTQVNIFGNGGHNQLRLRLGEEHAHTLKSALRITASARRAVARCLQSVDTVHAHNTFIRVGEPIEKPQ